MCQPKLSIERFEDRYQLSCVGVTDPIVEGAVLHEEWNVEIRPVLKVEGELVFPRRRDGDRISGSAGAGATLSGSGMGVEFESTSDKFLLSIGANSNSFFGRPEQRFEVTSAATVDAVFCIERAGNFIVGAGTSATAFGDEQAIVSAAGSVKVQGQGGTVLDLVGSSFSHPDMISLDAGTYTVQVDFDASAASSSTDAVFASTGLFFSLTHLPRVTEVSFSGEEKEFNPISSDASGSETYDGKSRPHWRDGDGDAVADYKPLPVSYVKGALPSLRVVLSEDSTLPPGLSTSEFRGVATFAGSVYRTEAVMPWLNSSSSIAINFETPLPSSVSFLEGLEIEWAVRLPGAEEWFSVSTTEHDIYVTDQTPLVPVLYHTLVDVAVSQADGARTRDEIIAATWAAFSDREIVQRTDVQNGIGPPRLLRYGDHGNASKGSTVEELLLNAEGGELAWASLFEDALLVNGVTQNVCRITKLSSDRRWFVRQASGPVSSGTSGSTEYPYVYGLGSDEDLFLSYEQEWQANVIVPAQGNTRVRSIFGRFALVQVDGHIYHPAFGGDSFDHVADWEDYHISGIAVLEVNFLRDFNGDGVSEIEDVLFVRPNEPGVEEVRQDVTCTGDRQAVSAELQLADASQRLRHTRRQSRFH